LAAAARAVRRLTIIQVSRGVIQFLVQSPQLAAVAVLHWLVQHLHLAAQAAAAVTVQVQVAQQEQVIKVLRAVMATQTLPITRAVAVVAPAVLAKIATPRVLLVTAVQVLVRQ
jgi:hypothetical protein